jgi:fatty acid desaturase
MEMNIFIYCLMGIVLGLFYAWAFSASRAYKKLFKSGQAEQIRMALINKIASILLTLIVLIIFTTIVAASHDPVINLLIFVSTGCITALASWRLAYHKLNGLGSIF